MLRANRIFADSGAQPKASEFASNFRGGAWQRPVSESQISRWETGQLKIPHAAVRRYEELLSLPINALVSTADGVYRYFARQPQSRPMLTRDIDISDGRVRKTTDDLLDRCLGRGEMAGDQWDTLTSSLLAFHDAFVPKLVWTALSERLLSELLIADGRGWLQRSECISRLLGHHWSQESAIYACASMGADPNNPAPIEAVSSLDATGHSDASFQILKQITDPSTHLAFLGGLLGSVRKTRFGHFTGPQQERLTTIAVEILLDPLHHSYAHPLAAEIIRLSPSAEILQNSRLMRILATDTVLHSVVTDGRTYPEPQSNSVIVRICEHATGRVSTTSGYRESILPQLVDEMLFSPVTDVRLYAAFLVGATPYRIHVAAALAEELARESVIRDEDLAQSILRALRSIGGEKQRSRVEHLIVADGIPNVVTEAAAFAIGHVGSNSAQAYWELAIQKHLSKWHRAHNRSSESIILSLVYGLGMAGETKALQSICGNPTAPPSTRESARWWLEVPRWILRSAKR